MSFEEFWKAWPKHFRKVGMKQCQAKWKREKLDDEDKVMQALEAAKKSKQWTQQESQFIPLPMSWLNQQPWLDMEEEKGEVNPAILALMSSFIKRHASDEIRAFRYWNEQTEGFQRFELLRDQQKFGIINLNYTITRTWKDHIRRDALAWWSKQPSSYRGPEMVKDREEFGKLDEEFTMLRCWKEQDK